MMRGFAALFKLIVLKTNNSKLKCTRAARNENRVAPAHITQCSRIALQHLSRQLIKGPPKIAVRLAPIMCAPTQQ